MNLFLEFCREKWIFVVKMNLEPNYPYSEWVEREMKILSWSYIWLVNSEYAGNEKEIL